ncbi:MAG TPA: hypothetical protein VMS22_12005 [Candidatus Eisenbacteria bacterium]|nr:hypothetical protein [Candidatus Eisenbacteria bacterium]
MSTGERPRGLATTCLVETAEGPVAMVETPNKGFAVLTRLPSGELGFRQLIKVVTHDAAPLVRVVLDSGHAVVVASGHPFFRTGMAAVAAADLAPGDHLETAFRYPDGYAPPDVGAAPHAWGISVRAVEPAGEGPVMTGMVRDTHALFLTAGVLCGE